MSDESLPNSEIILYQTEDGRTRLQCRFEDETLWFTQAQITERDSRGGAENAEEEGMTDL